MATKERPLYPKQKKIETFLVKDGRHCIPVNESEGDSYFPHQYSQNPFSLNDPKLKSIERSREQIEDDKNKFSRFKRLELDGFSSLGESTSWAGRIVWLILLCLVLGVLTFYIIKTINDYAENKVITTLTVTRTDSLKFPLLYICPVNYLNESYYSSHSRESATANSFFEVSLFNQTKKPDDKKNRPKRDTDILFSDDASWQNEILTMNGFHNFQFDSDHIDYDYENMDLSSITFDEDLERNRVEREVTNATFTNATLQHPSNSTTPKLPPLNMTSDEVYNYMLNVGLDKSQIFLGCKFFEDREHKPLPCDDIVEEAVDINYGKCYKISLGDKQQKVEARGLSLIIDTFRSRVRKYTKTPNKLFNGMNLAVHYDTLNPVSYEKIMVGGGRYMKLDVSLEHVQLINVDRDDFHQPCVGNDENLLNVLNVTYSQTACQMDCFLRQIVDRCRCTLMMDRAYILTNVMSEIKFCSKENSVNCIIPKITDNADVSDAVEKCKAKCFVRCDTWRYKVNPSSMDLNPLAFDDLPANTLTEDILQLDISYSTFELVEITQSLQTTLDTFIGNLGGQITGWVGGSMLTLINIPIMIFSYIAQRSVKRAKTLISTKSSGVENSVIMFQSVIKKESQSH